MSTEIAMTTDTALLRLLQLSSAALPVGGYAFSHGLEYAIEADWLSDQDDIHDWLLVSVNQSLAKVDMPLLIRLHETFGNDDIEAIRYWNNYALACRETSELRLTDTAMGSALIRLLKSLDVAGADQLPKEISFITAFALATNRWQIDQHNACIGYLWSWLENQVTAATKLVPLGQTQAQQLLSDLLAHIPANIEQARLLQDDELGASLPALAMASAWHETQHTRLFRS